MSALVEAMARAIYREFENRPDYAQLQMNGITAEECAIAAIKAMREPSIAQRHVCTFEEAEITWPRMIDAAIQEHSTTPPRNAS